MVLIVNDFQNFYLMGLLIELPNSVASFTQEVPFHWSGRIGLRTQK